MTNKYFFIGIFLLCTHCGQAQNQTLPGQYYAINFVKHTLRQVSCLSLDTNNHYTFYLYSHYPDKQSVSTASGIYYQDSTKLFFESEEYVHAKSIQDTALCAELRRIAFFSSLTIQALPVFNMYIWDDGSLCVRDDALYHHPRYQKIEHISQPRWKRKKLDRFLQDPQHYWKSDTCITKDYNSLFLKAAQESPRYNQQ